MDTFDRHPQKAHLHVRDETVRGSHHWCIGARRDGARNWRDRVEDEAGGQKSRSQHVVLEKSESEVRSPNV